MPANPYILWTARGISCQTARTADGWQVSVEASGGGPFLRRFAHSRGDAGNQAEYLRLLLDRSRSGARKPRDRRPLILIVEDDAETLIAYERMLRLERFRTASAPNLAEARRLMRQVKPSAILLDDVPPDGDGTTFARELRRSHHDATVPVVLVTGLDPAGVDPPYEGGPDALLGTPCRRETLIGVLKLLVQRTAAPKAPKPSRQTTAPLERTRCPLCGVAGALIDGRGRFTCQQCGKEGAFRSAALRRQPESRVSRSRGPSR